MEESVGIKCSIVALQVKIYLTKLIKSSEEAEVLMKVSNVLKPDGKAYFAVHRDIQYEGFKIYKIHKKETYQCLIKLA